MQLRTVMPRNDRSPNVRAAYIYIREKTNCLRTKNETTIPAGGRLLTDDEEMALYAALGQRGGGEEIMREFYGARSVGHITTSIIIRPSSLG